MASRRIEDLHPKVQNVVLMWLSECAHRGVDVMVYCTYRDEAEQNELYTLGRTKANPQGKSAKKPMGNIVTNAKAGDSMHQYRVAWDCVPVVHGKPQWNDTKGYKVMAEVGKKFGIEWAGEWKTFKEMAHFQYTEGLTLADFKKGKTIA